MSDVHATSHATDGYLQVRALLDPRRDIQHLKQSYRLIAALTHLRSTLCDRALTHRVQRGVPCSYDDVREGRLSAEESAAITARWRELVPDTLSWLRLGPSAGAGQSVGGAQVSASNGARS